MSNFDTVVLDGEMGLFTTIREGDLPYYTGSTEVTPSDEAQTLPTADTIVTSNITVNAIPEEYIDTTDATLDDASLLPSGVTAYADGMKYTGTAAINDDGDLVVSGDTVTVPAGFYEEPAAASVASGSATTPSTSITANPSISVGNDGSITASVSATQSVTPSVTAGYVSSGTAGTITVSGSGSSQLSTQAGTTITPTTSQQTAVAAGKFTTGAVIVDAMPSGTAGTPTATKGTVSNHSVSVTPSVTNQTGYITGGTKTGTAVTVSASELVSGSQNITSNDTYDVTNLASVTVAVPGDTPTLQTKSVSYTPTESQQTATITASTGYDGLEEVDITVGAISSSYVGSAIDRNDSTDLTASGATVTAPAGYYANAATKTLDEQAAQTIHPSTTDQTIASGKYLTGAQTIKAVTTNITADKIVSGFTAEIGDADDSDCVASVTGTASGSGYTDTEILMGEAPSGAVTITLTEALKAYAVGGRYSMTDLTINYPSSITAMDQYTIANNPGLITITINGFSGSQTANYYVTANENLEEFYFVGFSGSIAPNFIRKNAKLSIVDFDEATSMSSNVFYDDHVLQTVILRSTSICAITNNTFGNSPFSSGKSGGTIYIPKSLYDHLGDGTSLDYKAATNWSTYDGYGTITWAKIEGSIYE